MLKNVSFIRGVRARASAVPGFFNNVISGLMGHGGAAATGGGTGATGALDGSTVGNSGLNYFMGRL